MGMLRCRRIVLFIFLGFTVISCKKIQGPEYRSIENFKVDSFGVDQSKIRLNAVYFNPNNFSVKLKETECNIYADSLLLGHFIQDTLISVPAKSDFLVPLEGMVNIQNLLRNPLMSLFGREILIKVDGNTMIGKGGIFIHYPIHYEGRHSFDFFK